MAKQIIFTSGAPKAVGPYSQGVKANGFLFVSGQIGLDPDTGKLKEGGVKEQTGQALENLEAIVKAAGLGLSDVVKVTVLLSDMNDFASVNAIYAERFSDNPPARAAFGVVKLPLGALIEIEAVAVEK
jgi:2-iminobutanoate/2-iminopropanoate deaminase